jgi:hypothetical protein
MNPVAIGRRAGSAWAGGIQTGCRRNDPSEFEGRFLDHAGLIKLRARP